MSDRAWVCEQCGSWWVHGNASHSTAPSRCYNDGCGSTRLRESELKRTTVSGGSTMPDYSRNGAPADAQVAAFKIEIAKPGDSTADGS